MRTKEEILKDSAAGYHERAMLDTIIDIRDRADDIAAAATQLSVNSSVIRDILADIAGLLAERNIMDRTSLAKFLSEHEIKEADNGN